MMARTTLTLAFSLFVLATTAATSLAGVVRAGTFYEEFTSVNCPSSTTSTCFVEFAPTPADKFLTIKSVNCIATIPGANIAYGVFGLIVPRLHYFAASAPVATSTGNVYVFNGDLIFKVGKNKTPFFYTFATNVHTGGSIDCKIAGELSDT